MLRRNLSSRKETMQHHGCTYYGHSGVIGITPARLIASHGNQCALIRDSHAPCAMEVNGQQPDELDCPIVARVLHHRISGPRLDPEAA
jgi:hypothetical protein